jgi:hypothetical protein
MPCPPSSAINPVFSHGPRLRCPAPLRPRCPAFGLQSFSSHSLRKGGATAEANAGVNRLKSSNMGAGGRVQCSLTRSLRRGHVFGWLKPYMVDSAIPPLPPLGSCCSTTCRTAEANDGSSRAVVPIAARSVSPLPSPPPATRNGLAVARAVAWAVARAVAAARRICRIYCCTVFLYCTISPGDL